MLVERERALHAANSFLEEGLVEIEVDPKILGKHLATIQDGMRRMSDDPEAQALFPYTILGTDEMGWDEDAGFHSERSDETKDYFHHCPGVEWDLHTELGKSFLPFLRSCAILTGAAERNVMQLLRAIDGAHGTEYAREFADMYIVTRILRYRKIDAHIKEDAYPHFDRDAISHHWWASHPGLMVYTHGTARRVDERAWNRAAIFPGKKFLALTQGAFGLHGLHGVRDTREVSEGNDRIAIVTFTHCRLPPYALAWLQMNDATLKGIAKTFAL